MSPRGGAFYCGHTSREAPRGPQIEEGHHDDHHSRHHPQHLPCRGLQLPLRVAQIEKRVGQLKGATDAAVTLAPARVTVDHDPSLTSTEEIVEAIGKAGYTATLSVF